MNEIFWVLSVLNVDENITFPVFDGKWREAQESNILKLNSFFSFFVNSNWCCARTQLVMLCVRINMALPPAILSLHHLLYILFIIIIIIMIIVYYFFYVFFQYDLNKVIHQRKRSCFLFIYSSTAIDLVVFNPRSQHWCPK